MRRILVPVVVLAFVAAACGGSDPEPSADTEAAAPPTTEAPAPTTEAPPPTTEAPPPTTEAPPATTEAPPATTEAPPPTTEAPPPTTEAPAAAALPSAVEGTLLEGQTPAGFDTLQTATTIARTETCPGTPAYGGIRPVAYSESIWARDPLTGPFLDVSISRFESAEAASEAFNNYREEVVACGEFPEPSTGAVGSFSYGEDPGLGDESFGTDYAATFQGLPVNRYGVLVRIGDSMYSSGATHVFVDPDKAVVLEALNTFLGQ